MWYQRQTNGEKVEEWMLGAGEDVGSYWFNRNSVSVWEDEEADGW